MDRDSSELLENAFITMYKQINGSWTTVESKYSDITGRAQFVYTAYTNYKFYVSKDTYEDYIFYLSPILFSSYDVKLTKITLLNYSMDFDMIAVIFSPQTFKNGDVTTFSFIITSPTGLLTDYGINLTYPGGSNGTTGVNAIGEQLNVNLNVTGASVFDVVTLTYYYTTTTGGIRTFVVTFPIITDGTTSFSMYRNRDVTFGLGVFERFLISVLIVIFVVGIATLIGQAIAGFALGLLLYGLLVYTGFLPFWAVAIPMFVGIIFLIWRTSQ